MGSGDRGGDGRRDLALEATGAAEAPNADLATLPVDGPAPSATAASELPEVPGGRFELDVEIGRGGLGRVLRARDRVLKRTVAIKELLGGDSATRHRFVRETLITARLQHPAIVPVYDAGRWPDRSPFYAMKLVAGRPLADVLADARTLEARLALLPTVLAVADAIAYAHSERIVHRDLKPGNILVGSFGETVVIDWGLAKDLTIEDRDAPDAQRPREPLFDQTVAGIVMGTPGYMAPEQAAGEDADERADVYALGAILYHVVAGRCPHEGKTLDEVIRRVIAGEVTPLLEREPRAPLDLAAIVQRAMALDMSTRYPTARQLAEDLRRFETGQLVGAHRYSAREILRRWIRRHRAPLAVAVAALLVVVGLSAFGVAQIVAEKRVAEEQRDRAQHAQAQILLERAEVAADARDTAEQALFLAHAHSLDPTTVPAAVIDDLADRTARVLWAARLGSPALVLAVSPDSGAVMVGTDAGAVVALDAATGHEVDRFDAPHGPVIALAVSPDGARLATGTADGLVVLWDVGARRIDRQWVAHTRRVTSLAFAADGRTLYSTSDDATAAAWIVDAARLGFRVSGHERGVSHLALSPDGSVLATASDDGTARLWRSVDGAPLATVLGHQEDVSRVMFTPRGDRLVTAGGDGTLRVSDVRTGQSLLTLRGHDSSVTALTTSPDGTLVVSGSADETVRVWSLAGGEQRHRLSGLSAWIADVAPIDGGVVAAARDGVVIAWALPRDADARDWQIPEARVVRRVAFAADGGSAVTVGDDQTIRRWSVPAGEVLTEWRGHDSTITAVALFDDDRALLTASHDEVVKIWDVATRSETTRFVGHTSLVWGAAVDRSGAWALSGGSDRDVRLWNLRARTLGALLRGHTDTVNAVAFSPDGQRAASGANDRTVIVWDLVTRAAARRIPDHAGQVASVAFSPDGRHLATAAWDDRVHIWTFADETAPVDLDCGKEGCDAIAYSPDGRYLAGGGRDGALRVWDATSGTELRRIPAHVGRIYGIAVAPDGDHVLTCGLNGRIRLWSLDRASLQETSRDSDLVGLVEERTGLALVDGRIVLRAPEPR